MQAVAVQRVQAPASVARRSSVTVRCQAAAPRTEAPKKAAAALLAGLAAVTLVLAPAANAADARPAPKSVVCASNPTAKVCLAGSAKQ